ncbi:hypothetical protein TUBRATIS_23720 [Tubulinosema ratisbonensis]|uniref:Uncharacterized protein n=1 Tax=Tubulinosema ratisbonensis TaxID=291195 RepID=A0A437AJ57_9MICR|nr:hypothetical protein TUBRATIS_23720 [Tubulinosema ratisbonensis]
MCVSGTYVKDIIYLRNAISNYKRAGSRKLLFHKFSEVVIFFVRIIYFFDDYIMLCYFFNFLFINFIYTIRILKYYLYILQPEVLTLLLIELLAVIIALFLLLNVTIIYVKDSYFGFLFNVKEILIILFWKTIILLSIYIVIFIPIIFYLQVTHFIFYILVSLFLLLIATGVLYKFIYNNFNLELTHFVAILNSFFFEIVIIFMFTITVFNEFILAQYEVGKKGFFYLFDKKAYVDEKTWAHDVINKYL